MSRYETFDKCKRMYFYTYYSKYVSSLPPYKMRQLKELTSVPLEIGNVVHDVMEAFLRRLLADDSSIDEQRFFAYAREKMELYFSHKTFLETYYGYAASIDIPAAQERVDICLKNFCSSPIFGWLLMKAIRNKNNWMIEPEGYGETRLAGLKAYCKMDFLFPVDDHVYILDWKTGKKDSYKHTGQLIGYAAAASENFSIPVETIFPKIIYLYPEFSEFECACTAKSLDEFYQRIRAETDKMYAYCADTEKNVPLPIEKFPMNPSESICRHCNYQELCFPGKRNALDSGMGNA